MTRRLGLAVAVNLAPLALMWLLGFALMRIAEGFSAPGTVRESTVLFGIVAGALLASKIKARVALFLLAIFFAEQGSLLIAHLYYGFACVNGGPVQVAILLASGLGVIMGAVTNRRRIVAAP